MICPKCGNPTEDGSLFCGNCGADLRNSNPSNTYSTQSFPTQNQIPAGMTPPQMPPAPKKPMPKWVPILVVELALLVLCGVGFKKIFDRNNSPEYVAENYFVSMANGDWKTAYDLLDFDEKAKKNPFTDEKAFESMQKQKSHSVIHNYVITPQNAAKNLDSLLNSGKTNTLSQQVSIEYKKEGAAENSESVLSLNQVAKNTWKVSTSSLICENFTIHVLHGATVTVNNVKLDKNYLTDSNVDDYSEDGMHTVKTDVYQIPKLYAGTYSIQIALEDMQEVETSVEVYEDESDYSCTLMNLTTEAQDMLIQKTSENMKQIYYAALTGKRFQTIESLFTANADKRADIKESYEDMMTAYNEGSNKVLWIRFKDLTAKTTGNGYEVSIRFDYDVHYSYKDWWDGHTEEDTYSGSDTCSFYFVKENDAWVQSNFGCYSLYY